MVFKAAIGWGKRKKNMEGKGCGEARFYFILFTVSLFPRTENTPLFVGLVCLLQRPRVPSISRLWQMTSSAFPMRLLPWLRSFQCFSHFAKCKLTFSPYHWNQNTPKRNSSLQRGITQSRGTHPVFSNMPTRCCVCTLISFLGAHPSSAPT